MCVVEDIQLSRLNKRARRRRTVTRSAQRSGSGPLLDQHRRLTGRTKTTAATRQPRPTPRTEVRDGDDSADRPTLPRTVIRSAPRTGTAATRPPPDAPDTGSAPRSRKTATTRPPRPTLPRTVTPAPDRYSESTKDRQDREDGGNSAAIRRRPGLRPGALLGHPEDRTGKTAATRPSRPTPPPAVSWAGRQPGRPFSRRKRLRFISTLPDSFRNKQATPNW